ncbi:MAG: TrbC/VirB2 family protein [Advenella sp.]|nr:TrbC/VirB2 family protein [Advenella sp.]
MKRSIKSIFSRVFQSKLAKANALALAAFVPTVTFAQAAGGGLKKAETALGTFRDQLYIILPIAAVIAGIIIAVLYAAEIMRKDDAVRWAIGVVLAGSIAEIVVLLWK